MKFTPSQVIEMRQQADAAATAQIAQCEDKFHPDWQEVAEGIFATLAADRALEAAAQKCDVTPPQPFRPSIEAAHAIRAMKEQQ